MRLLLIRHGETVDNVAGIYAGTTDSSLTTHGVLQAARLGAYLAATGVKITHIFSSDLQRAFKTAESIRLAQPATSKSVITSPLLREQDFGFYEGKHFYERPKGSDKSARNAHREVHLDTEGFQDVESKQSMIGRVEAFLEGQFVLLLSQVDAEETVAVVAHGIILNYLWRGILARFQAGNVTVATDVAARGSAMGVEYLCAWSNTGYVDLEVKSKVLPFSRLPAPSVKSLDPTKRPEPVGSLLPDAKLASDPQPLPNAGDEMSSSKQSYAITSALNSSDPALPDGFTPSPQTSAIPSPATSLETSPIPPKLLNMSLVVKAVNSQEHLKGLKKTQGGIGNLKHDDKQKTMDSFFKRQKLG